ncbi:MAG: AraC family transcriptional regulator [Spirochaetales bacterium]|nr:AraC family transcriptional regulator [Spirochaetales bacterium]
MTDQDLLNFCDTLISESSVNCRILLCERFDQSSSLWNTNEHSHDYLEMLYFIRGRACVDIDESKTVIGTNELIIYSPNVRHHETIDLIKHQEAICLGVRLDGQGKRSELSGILSVSDPDHTLEWLFSQLHLKFREEEGPFTDRLFEILLLYIRDNCLRGNGVEQSISLQIINYMKQHYSEKIYQDELAALVNVSSAYMYRVFRKETGQTPMEYLNRLRVDVAMDYAGKRSMTLEEIGIRVGIADPKYFSKIFRKYAGASFREYRKVLQLNK